MSALHFYVVKAHASFFSPHIAFAVLVISSLGCLNPRSRFLPGSITCGRGFIVFFQTEVRDVVILIVEVKEGCTE